MKTSSPTLKLGEEAGMGNETGSAEVGVLCRVGECIVLVSVAEGLT